jgi:alcohol dehydrogenase (cytochrome c)/quinohemoprotein ethanol dehydrogenase
MAFSPATGLAYIPAQDFGIPFAAAPDEAIKPGVYNTGGRMAGGTSMGAADLARAYGTMKGYLIAWDPVARKVAWRREMPAPFNGGILATAGGLLFEGTVDRSVNAFDARNGRLLWSFPAQAGISAPPITYSLDGVQYVAVMVGYGGGWPMLGGQLALKAGQITGPNRLLVFRLGGKATLPPQAEPRAAPLDPPADTASAQQIASGDGVYGRYCLRCHGAAAVSASFVPDLRHSAFLRSEQAMRQVVLGGLLKEQGMPQFSSVMDESEFAAVRAYLIHRANEDKKAGVP